MAWWGKQSQAGQILRQRETFEALLKPQMDALFRTAMRLTGHRGQAEDITQEACLKAYERFDSYRPDSHLRAWLMTILRHTFIDSVRRQGRSPFVAMTEEQYEVFAGEQAIQATHEKGPAASFAQRALVEQAQKARDDLPEDLRLVVCMALLEDMSYQDIADALGCPIGTVRSRLSRGRYRMQQMLTDFAPAQAQEPSPRLSVVKSSGGGR
ncbi:MAG: sigma-70 family RNA polymerase sigma factor [Burkholderiaceae bacterium]